MLPEDFAAVEAHYRRSAFIADICVFPAVDGAFGLNAVVLPDLARLRVKRIVNIAELLRFEMDGRALDLPASSRVAAYEIVFTPLPASASGLDREAIRQRAIARATQGADRALTPADREWLAEPHAAAVVDTIRARTGIAHVIGPNANLEIDLGIDSLDRVALVGTLERQCGVSLVPGEAHAIFTVQQLSDALQRGIAAEGPREEPRDGGPRFSVAETRSSVAETDAGADATSRRFWSRVFDALPPSTDRVLGPLLDRKPLLVPLLFLLYRLWRVVVRLEVSGIEHLQRNEAFIIAPNHQSYLDPFFIASVLPYVTFSRLFLLGATEYFETPLTSRAARALNIVAVDPDANLVGAMQAAAFGLHHGKILLLFPEGERSIDGNVKRFKKGAAILSAHLGVPIVPVAIDGAFEVWPRGRSISWRRLGFWNRHRVRIRFGPPVLLGASSDYASGARTVQDAVAALRG